MRESEHRRLSLWVYFYVEDEREGRMLLRYLATNKWIVVIGVEWKKWRKSWFSLKYVCVNIACLFNTLSEERCVRGWGRGEEKSQHFFIGVQMRILILGFFRKLRGGSKKELWKDVNLCGKNLEFLNRSYAPFAD